VAALAALAEQYAAVRLLRSQRGRGQQNEGEGGSEKGFPGHVQL
jgi:hypothetical protein